MSLATLPAWAGELIANERVAHLALLDGDDRPRVLPVTFALAGDSAWSAIDAKPKRTAEPARVRWLRRRPEAALCVDVYDDDWDRLAWVQLLGRIEVLELGDGAAGLEALTAK
jgi:PPOX class probable F420-dependent enzyme